MRLVRITKSDSPFQVPVFLNEGCPQTLQRQLCMQGLFSAFRHKATSGLSQWRFQQQPSFKKTGTWNGESDFVILTSCNEQSYFCQRRIPQIELNRDSAPSHNTSCAPKDDTIMVNRIKSRQRTFPQHFLCAKNPTSEAPPAFVPTPAWTKHCFISSCQLS